MQNAKEYNAKENKVIVIFLLSKDRWCKWCKEFEPIVEQLEDDYNLRTLTVDNDLTQEKKIHFNAIFFIVFDLFASKIPLRLP